MNLASLFYYQDILLYISFIPLIGIFLLIFINPEQQKLMKIVAINFSSIPFILFLFVWGGFKKSVGTFQFVSKLLWIPVLNLNVTLGIDGISLFFLLLTTFLIPLCILISWNSIGSNLKGYLISFLIIEYFLIGVFCVLDVLMFYILFESILIFMFLDFEQKILWFTFYLAFSAKVPMVPVHLWLPEAHVEAPTAGSVILAGVLLKLGTYGFIRFSLPLFPQASFYFAPLVYTMSLIGIVYASLTAIRQTDFKRIIAYTSVAHMNVVMLGIFSFNNVGIEGALLQSLSQ